MFKFGRYARFYRAPADEGLLGGADTGGEGGDGEGGDGDGGDNQGDGEGAGSGGSGDGGEDGGGSGDGGSGDENDGGKNTSGERPDHIQEQFWDTEKGEIKTDDLAKSYNELRETHNKLLNEKVGDVPKDADGYFTKDNVKDDVFQLPEGTDLKSIDPIKSDDPALRHLAGVAQANNIAPEAFNNLVAEMTIFADGLLPAPFDEAKEMEALGDNGPRLTATLKSWADNMKETGHLSEDEFEYMMAFGKPAIGIRTLNKLRSSMGGKMIPVDLDAGENSLPSQDEWYKNKPDPRTNPDDYKKWQEQGERIFGTGTTGGNIGRGMGVSAGHGAAQHTKDDDPGGRMTRKRV